MNKEDMIKWLENLCQEIGTKHYILYLTYGQALEDIIETLKGEQENE